MLTLSLLILSARRLNSKERIDPSAPVQPSGSSPGLRLISGSEFQRGGYKTQTRPRVAAARTADTWVGREVERES